MKGEVFQRGGRGRVNPSPGTGDKGLVARDLHALRPEASADYGKRLTLVKSGAFVWRVSPVLATSGGVWGGTDSGRAMGLVFLGFYGHRAGGVGGPCRGRRWIFGLSFFVRFFFRFLCQFLKVFGRVLEPFWRGFGAQNR